MSMQDEVHAYRSILGFCMSHIFEVNNNINAEMFIAWLTQSAFYASHAEWIIEDAQHSFINRTATLLKLFFPLNFSFPCPINKS